MECMWNYFFSLSIHTQFRRYRRLDPSFRHNFSELFSALVLRDREAVKKSSKTMSVESDIGMDALSLILTFRTVSTSTPYVSYLLTHKKNNFAPKRKNRIQVRHSSHQSRTFESSIDASWHRCKRCEQFYSKTTSRFTLLSTYNEHRSIDQSKLGRNYIWSYPSILWERIEGKNCVTTRGTTREYFTLVLRTRSRSRATFESLRRHGTLQSHVLNFLASCASYI